MLAAAHARLSLSSLTLLADTRKLYKMRYVDLPQSVYVAYANGMNNAVYYDNALITYLATLVPNLGPELQRAVVEGAVVGGGLTVIANAPNPAGQALLARFFDDAVSPARLFAGAALPTLIAALVFWI